MATVECYDRSQPAAPDLHCAFQNRVLPSLKTASQKQATRLFPHSLNMYLSKPVLISGSHMKFHKFSNSQLFLKHSPWEALGGSATGWGGSWCGVLDGARSARSLPSLSHGLCLFLLLRSLAAKYTNSSKT